MIPSAYAFTPVVKRTKGRFVSVTVDTGITTGATSTLAGASITGDVEFTGAVFNFNDAEVAIGSGGSLNVGGDVELAGNFSYVGALAQFGGTVNFTTASTVSFLGSNTRLGNTIASVIDLRGTLTTVNGGRILEKTIYGYNTDWTLTDNTVRRVVYTATTLTNNHTITIDFSSFVEFQTLDITNVSLFNLDVYIAGYGLVGTLGPGSGKKKIEFVRITSQWTWVIL